MNDLLKPEPSKLSDINSFPKMKYVDNLSDEEKSDNGFTFDPECNYEIDIYAILKDNDQPDIYEYMNRYREAYEPSVNITPLVISVQSAKAKMSNAFDLALLSNEIAKKIRKNKNFAIQGVFHRDVLEGDIKKPKPRKKGAFPNNMALSIRSPMGTGKVLHVKVFKNSSISMVGCKIKEDGIGAMKILEKFIQNNDVLRKINEEKFSIGNFETTMVNSNYSVGFKIDRDLLFNFLSESYSEIFSSYDPAAYAAVKIGFYYNTLNQENDGICKCPDNKCTLKKSSGKGSGEGIGQCKKVTIAIFESGNIVITGGRNIEQAKTAYSYINKIIEENAKSFALINLPNIYENMCENVYENM